MHKVIFFILMSISICYPIELLAQKSSSSSSSSSTSSRSSSSFSRPSTSQPSRSSSNFSRPTNTATRPSTPKATTNQQTRQSSNFTTPTKPTVQKTLQTTKLDNKISKLTTTNGKTVTREEAVKEFKKTHASTYTSKYKTEPKIRPKHIPNTTNVGGSNVNINYNSGYGGYGYTHPITGAWIMYDMMSDAVMMNAMMSNHYSPIVYTGYYSTSWMLIFPVLFIVCLVVLLIWKIQK